jgi:hypothetical protein
MKIYREFVFEMEICSIIKNRKVCLRKNEQSRNAGRKKCAFLPVHDRFEPYFEKERTLTMTLIELFDKTPVENILGSLALKPDKVVFITPESRKAIRALPNYQKILIYVQDLYNRLH